MKPTTPSKLLAANVRRLREDRGWRQSDLAALMRTIGFRAWVEGTAAQVEAGTRRVTTDELVALAFLLETPISKLFEPGGTDRFALLGGTPIPARAIAEAAAGYLPFRPLGAVLADAEEVMLVYKIAARLQVKQVDLIEAVNRLWDGRTIVQERERRLAERGGEGNERVRRGHVTRALVAELDEALPKETPPQ